MGERGLYCYYAIFYEPVYSKKLRHISSNPSNINFIQSQLVAAENISSCHSFQKIVSQVQTIMSNCVILAPKIELIYFVFIICSYSIWSMIMIYSSMNYSSLVSKIWIFNTFLYCDSNGFQNYEHKDKGKNQICTLLVKKLWWTWRVKNSINQILKIAIILLVCLTIDITFYVWLSF